VAVVVVASVVVEAIVGGGGVVEAILVLNMATWTSNHRESHGFEIY